MHMIPMTAASIFGPASMTPTEAQSAIAAGGAPRATGGPTVADSARPAPGSIFSNPLTWVGVLALIFAVAVTAAD